MQLFRSWRLRRKYRRNKQAIQRSALPEDQKARLLMENEIWYRKRFYERLTR